jgi:PKD domain
MRGAEPRAASLTAVSWHRRRAPAIALVVALGACLLLPRAASAVIHPASVLDGPANNILEVDGAAMAPDGTGGIVYRKQVAGVTHVFVDQFVNGRWSAPVEADGEDAYGASQPAIAAGEGGRLLVVWVQPRNINPKGVTQSELMSASLQPGASSFGQAIVVDPNVGEPYSGNVSGVAPSLAMSPSSGQAYVVYRVTTNGCERNIAGDPLDSACKPGDALVDVRVARFEYLTWSALGAVNRAPQLALRDPTPENAPAIGIALNGNGVVAWQEPDSGGVARIWVRRLFGSVQSDVLRASPETIGGRPVSSDADAPAIAVSPFGEARIAFRIRGAPGSAVTTTQLYVNAIASEIAPHGSQLEGAVPVPGAVAGGLGQPSAAIDVKGDFRLAWTQGAAVQGLAGDAQATGSSEAIGVAGSSVHATINPVGGATTAWVAAAGTPPAVRAREEYTQGAFQTAQLAGNIPGPVAGLALGGDNQGDALLAFTQGAPGQSEVVGDFVQAPPAQFSIEAPVGWVHGAVPIGWEAAPDALAGVSYAVYVDGRARLKGLTGLSTRLPLGGLSDGAHRIQVLASDVSGQQTMSGASELKVDANPPVVRVRYVDRRRGVRVVVRDRASGVDARATVVSFGDGHTTRRRDSAAHEYRRAGTYTITARVRDKLGNHTTVHLRVRVR